MVVQQLEMVIVKLVVLQELNIFYTYHLKNVLNKLAETKKTSLHLLQENYFVMSDLVLLEMMPMLVKHVKLIKDIIVHLKIWVLVLMAHNVLLVLTLFVWIVQMIYAKNAQMVIMHKIINVKNVMMHVN
jgi:hypothetical protein